MTDPTDASSAGMTMTSLLRIPRCRADSCAASCPGAESENETSVNDLRPRKRHQPSLVHPASTTALCSASGHILVVKCKTDVVEIVWKQLLEPEQGETAPWVVKMLEHQHDPEIMVLATYTFSEEREAAQSLITGLDGTSFYAASQNQVRISRYRIP